MGYNTKNYTEQGGERTVIGGTLSIPSGGNLELPGFGFTAGTDALGKTIRQALTAATVNAIENTTGVDLLVERITLTWAGTLANITLDVGTQASPTTSSDNLMDGVVLSGSGTTKYAKSNLSDGGSNGKAQQVWPAGEFITLTNNGTFTGLDDVLAHISVTPLEA